MLTYEVLINVFLSKQECRIQVAFGINQEVLHNCASLPAQGRNDNNYEDIAIY